MQHASGVQTFNPGIYIEFIGHSRNNQNVVVIAHLLFLQISLCNVHIIQQLSLLCSFIVHFGLQISLIIFNLSNLNILISKAPEIIPNVLWGSCCLSFVCFHFFAMAFPGCFFISPIYEFEYMFGIFCLSFSSEFPL